MLNRSFPRLPLAAVTACFVTGAIAGACGGGSAGRSSSDESDRGRDLQDGSASPGPVPDAEAFHDASGTPVTSTCGCSADLHSVIDCNGGAHPCPSDMGCSPTMGCIAPCAAAEANQSSIGCDYYSVDTEITGIQNGACLAAFVANTWTSDVTLEVERDGIPLDLTGAARIPKGSGDKIRYLTLPNGKLPPNEVAILFLAAAGTAESPCPKGITPMVEDSASITGTGTGSAFHIHASAPVVAYDILPYGGGNSLITGSTLLFPTSAWGTNYLAINPYEKSTTLAEFQPSIDVVAREDGTDVTLLPNVALVGGSGVTASPSGNPQTFHLKKGQFLQISQPFELTGSPIESNKPIGVWGAANCMNIPVDVDACDSAHQQIPPVNAFGHEYVAVRYRNRIDGEEESPPWRLVGAADGTKLTYVPSAPPGAPATLARGELAEFNAPGPFVVKSQDDKHPFYMAAYMTGSSALKTPGKTDRGDPEFVNVVPPLQYLPSYTFFTDPTYPETNLVMVRAKGTNGAFSDVNLDCAGIIGGWKPVGDYEYARIDLVRHDFQPQGKCDNGRHTITSQAPFGLTIWGWGSEESTSYTKDVSYAYPAGANLHPINSVVVTAKPH